MAPSRLSRSRKNKIFEILVWAHHDPHQFTWHAVTHHGKSADEIRHEPSGHAFRFVPGERPDLIAFVGTTCDGWNPDALAEQPLWIGAWSNAVGAFARWAQELRSEVAEPDAWAGLAEDVAPVAAPRTADVTPLSPDEWRLVDAALADLLATIDRTIDLTTAQRQRVEERFAYLSEARSRDLSLTDWTSMLIGQLTALVMDGVVPKMAAKPLFRAANAALLDLASELTRATARPGADVKVFPADDDQMSPATEAANDHSVLEPSTVCVGGRS